MPRPSAVSAIMGRRPDNEQPDEVEQATPSVGAALAPVAATARPAAPAAAKPATARSKPPRKAADKPAGKKEPQVDEAAHITIPVRLAHADLEAITSVITELTRHRAPGKVRGTADRSAIVRKALRQTFASYYPKAHK